MVHDFTGKFVIYFSGFALSKMSGSTRNSKNNIDKTDNLNILCLPHQQYTINYSL